ncbi:hypothetical protein BDA96_03G227200 [Sorghum bicolor]|uniref:No apical meristem-associated C-terminal domain-containing protein n=1 Tax=Sorghum bicolor TaxID=4558 RepID=A0A921RF19_SORBI|nr:hypothetical protein BDA96_03G227200 [Sorghum bicolor]
MSWESVSTDPIIGNEQPAKAYWTRITEHFHANKTFESDRTKNSLEHRWEAQLAYSGGKKKGFPFLHCWLKVRNSPKFQSINPREKRKASNVIGEEDLDSPQAHDSSQITQGQMPIGRKRAKEQLKNKGGDGGPYKNLIEELLVEKKEERKMKDLRWQKAKTMQERRISVEERRLMWEQEQKIMFCDVNTLDSIEKKNYHVDNESTNHSTEDGRVLPKPWWF